MKYLEKIDRRILVAISFFLAAVLIQVIPVLAITSTVDLSTLPTMTAGALTGNGQILRVNNGQIDIVPNCFTIPSPLNAQYEINCGQYPTYPNPSGMFNTYDESSIGPVLSASFMGSTTDYVQTFMQNLNHSGSADYVIANDRGTATSSNDYVDFGIANSTQSDSLHTLIGPYDAYLYNQSSRLLLGTATTTASSSIILSLGMQTGSPSITYDQYGHQITHGATPTSLSGCGTSPSVSGNDTNGVITTGSGLAITACSMTFKNPYPTGSSVTCSISTNSTLIQPALTAVSTTGFTVGLSLNLASGKIYYQCMASL